jgi:hypothetical protein
MRCTTIKSDGQIRNKSLETEKKSFSLCGFFALLCLLLFGGRKKEIELQVEVTTRNADLIHFFFFFRLFARKRRRGKNERGETVNKSKRAECNVIVHAILSESWVKRDFCVLSKWAAGTQWEGRRGFCVMLSQIFQDKNTRNGVE